MRFTKVIHREIEMNGVRWAIAMGPRGIYAREVGKRRWKAVHWAAILEVIADYEGQPEGHEPPIDAPLAAVEDGKGTAAETPEQGIEAMTTSAPHEVAAARAMAAEDPPAPAQPSAPPCSQCDGEGAVAVGDGSDAIVCPKCRGGIKNIVSVDVPRERATKWLEGLRATTKKAGPPFNNDTVDLGNWLRCTLMHEGGTP